MGTYRRWNEWDAAKYAKDLYIFGDRTKLQSYKDAWVSYNKLSIKMIAMSYCIPPEVLGVVAWIEVGGDPYNIDEYAFIVRSFDWSGPQWVDKHLTITKNPLMTSLGSVQIQLRRAAETLGLDSYKLDSMQIQILKNALKDDVINLRIVAKHLQNLLIQDNPNMKNSCLIFSDEVIRILGARYNRGQHLSLDDIKKNTSYGDDMVKFIPRVKKLLE